MPYFTYDNDTDRMNDAAIKKYCAEGGCVMGICAGSYLMTHWGFGLLAVDILDIDSWYRSKSNTAEVTVSETFNKVSKDVSKDKSGKESLVKDEDKQKSMADYQNNQTKIVT